VAPLHIRSGRRLGRLHGSFYELADFRPLRSVLSADVAPGRNVSSCPFPSRPALAVTGKLGAAWKCHRWKPGLTPFLGVSKGVAAHTLSFQRLLFLAATGTRKLWKSWRIWASTPHCEPAAPIFAHLSAIHLLLAGLGCFGSGRLPPNGVLWSGMWGSPDPYGTQWPHHRKSGATVLGARGFSTLQSRRNCGPPHLGGGGIVFGIIAGIFTSPPVHRSGCTKPCGWATCETVWASAIAPCFCRLHRAGNDVVGLSGHS